MIKVAILSYWHVHAKDYAKQATDHPSSQIVAVWDELPQRGRQAAEAIHVPFYENLDDLLSQKDIDAVIVNAPTNLHRDVMVAAAKAGKHIFTEKVIAPTQKECLEVLSAVKQAGVKLIVSLPRLNMNYTLAVQQILEQGLLGEVTFVRNRLSHNGSVPSERGANGWLPEHFYHLEQCGGGAMIDLGCHPMYLARLFLGMPESVSANYGYVTGKEVEDNAVAVLRYGNGALAVVEASFVGHLSPFSIEISGTEGSLIYSLEDNLVLRTTKLGDEAKKWQVQQLPDNRPDAYAQWISHIENGTNGDDNIAIALDLTRLMEASNQSARLGAPVTVSSDKLPS
jgi:predicted dehydrogenase